MLRKSFDGGVFETSRRFHDAVPASNQPALSPTRGSGVGLVVPIFTFEAMEPFDTEPVEPPEAHAVAATAATISEGRCRLTIRGDWGLGTGDSATAKLRLLADS